MDTKPQKSHQLQSNQLEGENVTREWSESVTIFYDYYQKTVSCLKETKFRQGVSQRVSLGRCSQEPLLALLMKMQAELQMLFQDMDCFDTLTPATNERFNTKLATHTRYLRQLNQQAFLLLVDRLPN